MREYERFTSGLAVGGAIIGVCMLDVFERMHGAHAARRAYHAELASELEEEMLENDRLMLQLMEARLALEQESL